MKRRAGLSALAAFCGLIHGACGEDPGKLLEGKLSALARDADGMVWATWEERRNDLATLQDGRWVPQPVAGLHENARPVALETSPSGEVICLWENHAQFEDGWTLTRHRAGVSRTWAHFREALQQPRLLGCAGGDAIITHAGRAFLRISEREGDVRVTPLPEGLFVAPEKQNDGSVSARHVGIRAIEDAAGNVWLWSAEQEQQRRRWRLKGLVRIGLGEAPPELVPIAATAPPISVVAVWNAEALIVALAGRGLWLLPLDTHKPYWMAGPEPGVVHYVEQFFHDGTAWHLITTPQPTRNHADFVPIDSRAHAHAKRVSHISQRVNTLWRLEYGRWVKVIPGLDEQPAWDSRTRPWLATAAGLFLASRTGPPWFIAKAKSPRLLAPDRAFPLPAVSHLYPTAGGKVAMLGGNLTCLWPADPPVVPANRWEFLITASAALPDSRGRVWCFRSTQSFACWDGAEWTDRALPAGHGKYAGFVRDDRDRGWLRPENNQATAICDFANGEWQLFPSFQAALQAQLPRGVRLHIPEAPFCEPAFSADGRIGAFVGAEDIMLFEHGTWRVWKLAEVAGPDARVTSAPFFAPDGAFCIPVGESRAWHWDGENSWSQREGVVVPALESFDDQLSAADARGRTGARDRFGAEWYLGEKSELTKLWLGYTVPVFAQEEDKPFLENGAFSQALVDGKGNVFLRTHGFITPACYLFISARQAPPKTTAALIENRDDLASVRLAGASRGDHWFTTRLDGGPWQALVKEPVIPLPPLGDGPHVLEARACNAELTPDWDVATVRFEVRLDLERLSKELLATLAGDDLDQREFAARRLVSLGKSVVPKLRTAQTTAEPGLQWWIDAILQQIARSTR